MLQQIGPKFCETIIEYCQLEPARTKAIVEEIEAFESNKSQIQPQSTAVAGNNGAGLDDDPAAGGLLSVDGNIGLLGIIKDEDSCQDSDFSGDEDKTTAADLNKEINQQQEK